MVHNPYEVEPRKPLTQKQKVEMFVRWNGICCICGTKINGVHESWDEHINPLWLAGDNKAENRGPAHERCAREKTKKEATQRAKVRKAAARHMGAKKPRKGRPMPGTKASGWKHKLDGTWVRRDEE
jgi:5-methylcytosine-specific restriction protein A